MALFAVRQPKKVIFFMCCTASFGTRITAAATKYTMKCESKTICGWITALSQLTVAACVLYVGFLANQHMSRMVESWEVMANAVHKMQQDTQRIEMGMSSMDRRMWELNNRMGGMRNRLSPWGMMMP